MTSVYTLFSIKHGVFIQFVVSKYAKGGISFGTLAEDILSVTETIKWFALIYFYHQTRYLIKVMINADFAVMIGKVSVTFCKDSKTVSV